MKFTNRIVFLLLALVPILAVAVVALATLDQGHQVETPTRVLEQGPPNLPLIGVFNDVDAIVFCGGRGYTVGTIVDDTAFLDRFTPPRTYAGKADRHNMGIPNGPAGTRGMDLLPDCSRAFIADTEVNQLRIVDTSGGSKAWGNAKATEGLVGTIPDIDTPQAVAVGRDGNVYVTAGTNDPLLLQIGRKAGTPEAYEIKARLELTGCNTPRAMVLDDSFGFALIACSISNNVLKVGLSPLRVIASVRTHDPDNGRDGSGPYDIAIRKAGDKTFLYTANKNSDTVSVIEDQGSALALVAAVKVVGKPVNLTNCAAHGQDCNVIFSPEPWSVAVSPDGRFVFTSNNVDRSVGVICAANNQFLGSWRALPVLSTRLADVIATVRVGTDDFLYVAEGGTGLYPYLTNTLNHLYAAQCPG